MRWLGIFLLGVNGLCVPTLLAVGTYGVIILHTLRTQEAMYIWIPTILLLVKSIDLWYSVTTVRIYQRYHNVVDRSLLEQETTPFMEPQLGKLTYAQSLLATLNAFLMLMVWMLGILGTVAYIDDRQQYGGFADAPLHQVTLGFYLALLIYGLLSLVYIFAPARKLRPKR